MDGPGMSPYQVFIVANHAGNGGEPAGRAGRSLPDRAGSGAGRARRRNTKNLTAAKW